MESSDLRDHRFAHNFKCSSPVCRCGLEDENTVHYFLCCLLYSSHRIALLDNVSTVVGTDVNVLPNEYLIHVLLCGSKVYNKMCNKLILDETIKYRGKSERFDTLATFQIVWRISVLYYSYYFYNVASILNICLFILIVLSWVDFALIFIFSHVFL